MTCRGLKGICGSAHWTGSTTGPALRGDVSVSPERFGTGPAGLHRGSKAPRSFPGPRPLPNLIADLPFPRL
jgi:hypothetical protein